MPSTSLSTSSSTSSSSLLIHGVALLAFLLTAVSVVIYILKQRTSFRSRAASRRSSICSERYPLLLDLDEEQVATVEEGQSHVLHLYRHEDMSLAPRGLLSDLEHTQQQQSFIQQQEDKYLTSPPSTGSSSSWYGRWWKRRSKQQQRS